MVQGVEMTPFLCAALSFFLPCDCASVPGCSQRLLQMNRTLNQNRLTEIPLELWLLYLCCFGERVVECIGEGRRSRSNSLRGGFVSW